jgi:isopenicillin-N epimerase
VQRPARSPLAVHWSLDPDVVYLNHGAFGAAPVGVLERQAELRARLEREPSRFLAVELERLLDDARGRLAAFVGAEPDDLAFVVNATSAVNAVLRSLDLAPGDELLLTTHEYGASRNALLDAAERAGAQAVFAELPFPAGSADGLVEAVVGAVTPRTRLLLLDHVTSPTALVLPVERIAAAAAERGVLVLVDGAHGPGMVDVDLAALERAGVAMYAANCHKWICAPKGSGFLWVRRDVQPSVRPTSISHGATSPRTDRSRFRLEFDWTGTFDPTAWLCVPAAIDLVGSLLPGGWPELRERNRALALAGRRLVCEALGVEPPCPDELVGAMAAVPLPTVEAQFDDRLYADYRIEVPVLAFPSPADRVLRLSAQAYNAPEEYAYLADALVELTRPRAGRT